MTCTQIERVFIGSWTNLLKMEKSVEAKEIQQNREELLTCLHSVEIDNTNTKVNTKSVLRLWGRKSDLTDNTLGFISILIDK